MWLLQYPKATVLEYPFTFKVLTSRKHCSQMHYSTFIPTFH